MQSYRTVPLNFNDSNSLAYLPHPTPSQTSQISHPYSSHNPPPPNAIPTEIRNPLNQPLPFGLRNTQNDQPVINASSKPGGGMPLPYKTQIPMANNYVNSHQQSQKGPKDKQYMYRPSIQENDRLSSGLNFEDFNDVRKDYRRSQSIAKTRTPDLEKESYNSKGYSTYYRLSSDYKEEVPGNSVGNFQSNFKAQNYPYTQISDTASFKPKQNSSYISKFEEYSKKSSTSNGYPRQYNFRSYFDELKPSSSTFTELPIRRKQSSQNDKNTSQVSNSSKTMEFKDPNLKREGSKDNISSKNDYSKTLSSIGKDIETLKSATKQSKEVLEKQLTKNTYLTKLLEKRASKNFEETLKSQGLSSKNGDTVNAGSKEVQKYQKVQQQEPRQKEESSSSKQLQAVNEQLRIRVVELHKQLQDKTRQSNDKSKDIWDKSKIIIQKNKTIQHQANELREIKHSIQSKEVQQESIQKELREQIAQRQKDLIEKQSREKQLKEEIAKLQNDLRDTLEKLSNFQSSAKETLQIFQKQGQEKNRRLEESASEILNLNCTIEKLNGNIEKLNKKIEGLSKDKIKYSLKYEQLRVTQSKADIQLFQIKSLLIAREKQIMLLESELEDYKLKLQQKNNNPKASIQSSSPNFKEEAEKIEKEFIENQNEQVQEPFQEEEPSTDFPEVSRQDLQRIISCFEARQKELTRLLLEGETQHDHDKIINRLKELLESSKIIEVAKQAEQKRAEENQIYKMHHQYLQKKCQQMNRQLKRVGVKLAGASSQSHQTWGLVHECNQEIVLLNLLSLNQKYKDCFRQNQVTDQKDRPEVGEEKIEKVEVDGE